MSLDVYLEVPGWVRVHHSNVTHNLAEMAQEAGIYKHLWRPDEIGITKASELIEPLKNGIHLIINEPERFRALNPPNGWGDYEGFLDFVRQYAAACVVNPEARVTVDR